MGIKLVASIILFSLSMNTYSGCLDKYEDAISNKNKKITLNSTAIPLTGSGTVFFGYLSVVNTSSTAFASAISSSSSMTLLGASVILSSTTLTGHIIKLKDIITSQKIIKQAKIGFGKELEALKEEIEKRNHINLFGSITIAKIINDLDKKNAFCPKDKAIPYGRIKLLNIVEDNLPMKTLKQGEW